MNKNGMTTLVKKLRRAVGVHSAGEQTDAHLMGCFVSSRDEAAFEALVLRHGPMVLGVCRRVLGNAHDAEDAFQATFLILARKAASVWPPEAVARWLHGVAYHTALKARDASIRRRARERQAYSPPPIAGPAERWSDVRSILDQELSRLSDHYRAAVVLCDLEGLTRHDAALQLGWPEGTVAGRLARARELLANRLTRRGVALSAGGLATVLAEEIASAAPSLAMVSAALRASLSSKTPPAVAVLANSALHASVATRLWSAALLMVVLGLGGAGVWFHGANAAGDPIAENPPAGQKPPEIIKPALQGQVKKPGAIFRAPGSYTLAVALTADGKLLARGGADNAVDLWDVATGKKRHMLTGHTVPIMRLAFSPDAKTLASITGSWLPNDVLGEVKLWDVATGKERVSLKGHPNRMLSVAFSPDGKTLATSSETVKLWDVETGKEKMELRVAERPWQLAAWSLAFSPDGKTLATGTGEGPMDNTPGTVILWDVTTGKKRATLSGHGNSVTCVEFAPDGKTLASMSRAPSPDRAGALKLWDVGTAKERTTIALPGYIGLQYFSLAFTADSNTLISAMWSHHKTEKDGVKEGGWEIAVQQWETATGKARASFLAPFNYDGHNAGGANAGVFFSALSADGTTVAWGGAEEEDKKVTGTAHVWEVGSLATSAPKLSEEPEKGRTIKRMTMFLIDAKTKGVSEQTETKGTGIKQIEIAEGTVAKKVLPDAKDTNGDGINEYLGYLGREWVVKSVKMTLADDTLVEVQILLPKETGKATLQNVKNGGPRIVSDKGTRTWYAFSAEYHVPTDSSKEDIAQAEKDMEGLQGTWRLTEVITVVVKGDRMSHIDSRLGQDFITGTITIDPKTNTIEWPMETGLGTGVTMFGIYELKGDNLRIIFGDTKGRRPKNFDEKDGWLWVLKREKRPDDADGKAEQWTPLFNGKDLKGWSVEGDNPEAWRVEGGELLVDAAKGGKRYSWLLTEKTYSEFLLRFEYQLSEKATSGVAVWATRYEKVHPEGPNHLQVKLMDDPNYPNIRWPTGAIFWNVDGGSHIGPDRNAKLEPVGSWNRMEIETRAQALRISVNGVEVHSIGPDKLAEEPGAYAGLKRRTGHVGFGKGVGVARFRKIEIKELKPAADPKEEPRPLVKSIDEDEKLFTASKWQNEKPEAAWNKLSDKHKNQFGGKPWKKVELEIKKLVDSPDPQGRTHSVQLSFLKPDDELFSFGTERVEMREEKDRRLLVITNLDKVEYRIEYEFKNGKLHMRGSYLRREPSSGAIFVPEVFDGEYVAIPTTKAGGADVKQPTPKEAGDGWVSLFNQKDLTGWKTHPAAPGDWRVEDGILIGRGPKVSHLYTERSDYEDFHFRIEAKINAGGNSGQSFRKQFSAKIGGDGYEAQIDSSSHKAKTGSLYIHTGPAVAVEQVLVPVDTWFTQEVIVRGNHIVILVNGQKTVDFIDKNNNYARGHLALQVYDPATVVQFRRIEIKELKPAGVAAKGYLGLSTVRQGGIHGGPTIEQIGAGSPAAQAGLRLGDVIVGVNDTKVSNIPQFRAAMDNLKQNAGERITFRIDRDGTGMAIVVTVGELKAILDEKKRQRLEGERKKAIEQPPAAANVDDIKAALTTRLKDADAWTRMYAAEALWKIDNDPAAVETMIADLKDKAWQVRCDAAYALGRFGSKAKAAVPALTEALQDASSFVRSRVALALWQINKDPDAIPALIESLRDPNSSGHRSSAAFALADIGVEAKAAVPALLEALKDNPWSAAENSAFHIDAAKALWQIDRHPAAVPALVACLKEREGGRRMEAAEVLGIIGVEAKAAVPALIEALNDEKQFVRRSAAEALGAIGVEAPAAVPALLEMLKDKKDRGRVHAAEALRRINKHPAAVVALAAAVQDPADQADYYAHVALRRIGVEAKAAVPALTEALKAEKAYHRVEAAITLWQINKDPAVVPVLVQALKDLQVDGPVRVASAVASMNKDLAGVPVLIDIPSVIDVNRYVRVYAAKALGQINQHPAAVSALLEALKDVGACAGAAEALWQINKHPAAVPSLIENFKSSNGGVFALGRIGAEAKADLIPSKGQRP